MTARIKGGWDIHTHLLPASVIAAAGAGRFGMSRSDTAIAVPGFQVPLSPMGDPARLLARLDADVLDGTVVSPPPPLFRADLPPEKRLEYCQLLNDGLLESVAAAPARLRPMAYLPTDQPAMALRIARSLDTQWAGVIIGTELSEGSYADPVHHELWATLAEADLPVLLHPSESRDTRLKPFYLSNLLGNPYETALAAAALIFGDVPGTFPNLKVILSHGGSAAVAVAGRWQKGVTSGRSGISSLKLPPEQAISWFHVDSIVHSQKQLAAIVDVVGPDQVLLGSDWPFPMGTQSAEDDLGSLSSELASAARIGNPQRVFGSRLNALPGRDASDTGAKTS